MVYIKQISVKDNEDTTWNTAIYVCNTKTNIQEAGGRV